MRRVLLACLVCFVVAGVPACSKPNADEHFKKGNEFFDKSQWSEAILEYRATLQIAPKRGDAYSKLAEAYTHKSDMRAALGAYVRAADLLPNDVTAQLKAGNMLLVAGGFEDAKTRAKKALAIDPKNADAMILLGNGMAGLKDVDGAMTEYQDAIALAPDKDTAYANIGTLNAVAGKMPEAEANFRKAVEVAPKSVEARLSLASFLMRSNRAPEAEKALKDALALDPTNVMANRALGLFYMVSNRVNDAEPYFRAIAKTADTTAANIALADYYVVAKKYDEARQVLTDLAAKDASYAAATTRLAALDAAQGMRAQALARITEVLSKHPKEMPARLLDARLLAADGKRDDALAQANSIVKDEPNSSSAGDAFVLIGNIEASSDHPEEAIKAYEEALKRRAQPVTANLALAALSLSTRSFDKASTYAQAALALQPKNPLARSMVARVWLAQGNTTRAKDEIASLQKDYPTSPTVLDLVAAEQLASNQMDAARATYAKALQLSPTDREAATGLVTVDMRTGHAADATKLIDANLKTHDNDGEFLILAAKTYGSAGNLAKAEELLKKAIEVAPSKLAAYSLLGQVYISQHKLDDAKDQFQELVRRNPKSVPANTMLGMLMEAKGDTAGAEKQYQDVLLLDKQAAVAANNLAWIYVASNRNLDQALELARTAQKQLPDEPHVNDTLGWICYKKEMASDAVAFLEVAVKKEPEEPVNHYHLAKAYVLYGDLDKAKRELRIALSSKVPFGEADDARKTLAQLGG